MELKQLGLIKQIPRLAVINAAGANTLYHARQRARPQAGTTASTTDDRSTAITPAWTKPNYHPHTIASAIEISRPVNLPKALRALDVMNGVVARGDR